METFRERILIVDDEPSVLKMLELYLVRLGYSVTTAGSTDEAWSEALAAPAGFDVVVLDATLPGMSFQELAMRLQSADPRLCVLVASGYPVDMTAMEAAAPGRVGFMQKPFTGDMLAAAIRRMIAAKKEGL